MNSKFNFLAGGGEMGALMRAYDWEQTSLGHPDGWPSTLKTVVRLILSSNHPMLIWWGDQLIQFYNDAYRQSLGPERYTAALGQPGQECWAEVWHLVGPDVERIMSGGEAAWYEDRLVPFTRFGAQQDSWWTYAYSPIEDDAGVRGILAICNDVTADHLLRERLQDTNETIIETMDDGFALLEIMRDAGGNATDYKFVDVNRAFTRQTGLQDPIGKTARQLVPGLEQRWIDIYAEVGASGTARRFVEQSPAMGRWFSVYASRVENRKEERVALLFTDITDRKNAEDALRLSETQAREAAAQSERDRRMLDALLNAVPVGIVYADSNGALLMANARNRELWGAHPMPGHQGEYAEWKGWWADGSERHGERIAAADWALSRALRGDKVESDMVEIEPFGRPGERRTLLIRATAIRDEEGKVVGGVAANMDITEQVQAQRALRESEAKFQTIADAMPQMVWSATPDGKNDYSNKRWAEFCGVSDAEIVDSRWMSLIHPDDLPLLNSGWAVSEAAGTLFEIEHRIRHHTGDFRWVLNRALPVRDDAGLIVRWMGTVTDMHDQRVAADELKEANSRKDEFLAMLAHELRNPLAPISTAAQILRLSGHNPARIEHASEVITRQVRHMVELVDDLLDVSRVNRGLVELERQPVDIKSVIHSAVEQARPLIEGKNHTLAERLGAASATVIGDRKRLVQVMTNLLTNAAKYTPEGGELSVWVEVVEEEVRMHVADNGIGIDAALLPHIFELFTQAKRTPDRTEGGLGLGLALVYSMTALHGGRIEAASDGLGKGSQFTVILPRASGASPKPANALGEAAVARVRNPRRILIVDDNRDGAESLGLLLGTAGHHVAVEGTSAAALRRAALEPFDVYVVDIGLPDMDGYHLIGKLRAIPGAAAAPMVALSGYGQAQDIEASRRAGFHSHLVKPVEINDLLRLIDTLD